MRRAALLVMMLLLEPMCAFAGRPVFNKISLSDLISRSEVVLVVERPSGFSPIISTDARSCNIVSWPLMVRERLHSNDAVTRPGQLDRSPKLPEPVVKTGEMLAVTINPVALLDCGIRSTPGFSSGVSFSAENYASSLAIIDEPPKTFIVFLKLADGRWTLAAQNAFEDMSRLEEIRKIVLNANGRQH